MNKFSDGFSDNSYEDLLNEYAGESLGSKSAGQNDKPEVKKPAPAKRQTPPRVTRAQSAPRIQREKPQAPPKREEKPTFDIDISKKKKPSDFSLNLNTIKSFDEEMKEKHSKKIGSDTIQFGSNDIFSESRHSEPSRPVIEKRNQPLKKARRAAKQSDFRTASSEEYSVGNEMKHGEKKKFNAKDLGQRMLTALKENKKAFIIFASCFLVATIISSVALSCINDVLAINRDNEESIDVVLPNDADTKAAIDVLHDAGLIKNKLFCRIFINVMGMGDSDEKQYLPGVYYFTESMGVEKMIKRFKTSTTRGAQVSITIPEGYTIDQIFEKLEKNDICSAESLYKTVETVDFSSEYDFIKEIDNKQDRYNVLEGYVFPATYEFEQGADPGTVIRKFLDTFKTRWTDDYAKRAAELSMTTDEIIRLASVIEKEGNSEDQFKSISSVLHNRLNRSGAYPTLECDSTKDYVKNTIAKREKSTSKINSYILNYSTYECEGLPAGAICNPGQAAIEAALNPEVSQNYFFRHDKHGEIYLAKTYEQHKVNGKKVEKINAED